MIDRLRTIISYDRICVMDNGNAVEFDTPEVLHGKNGIFRAMCDHSNITLDDIRCARMSALVQRQSCGFNGAGGCMCVRCGAGGHRTRAATVPARLPPQVPAIQTHTPYHTRHPLENLTSPLQTLTSPLQTLTSPLTHRRPHRLTKEVI